MINLMTANISLAKAREAHRAFLRVFVHKRLTGEAPPDADPRWASRFRQRYRKYQSPYYGEIRDFVLEGNRLNRILTGEPAALEQEHIAMVRLFNRIFCPITFNAYLKENGSGKKSQTEKKRLTAKFGNVRLFIDELKAIFDYGFFEDLSPQDDYSAYHLAENLGVRACVYCNRTYTVTRTTRKQGKLMRPQFDHWFPQWAFPLLRISFYNLIPCCSYCNSGSKRAIPLTLSGHTHPYVAVPDPGDFRFDFHYDRDLRSYIVRLLPGSVTPDPVVHTMSTLKIDQMYEAHQGELDDLLRIKQAYGIAYLEKLARFFPGGLSEAEVQRLFFGTELDEKNYHLRPMSKFKYDILNKRKDGP